MLRWINRLKQNGKFHPMWIVLATTAIAVVAAVIAVPAIYEGAKEPKKPSPVAVKQARTAAKLPEPDAGQHDLQPAPAGVQAVHFTPPAESEMPSGEFGDMVKLGRNIFVHTQTYAKGFVGNGLNCVNCHLDAGAQNRLCALMGRLCEVSGLPG